MLELPLSGIKKIEEIAKSSNEYISLSQGAVRLGGIPQQIKAFVQEQLETDKTDYYESCWGIKPLREKIVAMAAQRYGANLELNQVIATHGCVGGLSLLFLALVEPGDEIIIPEPSYPAYTLLTQASRSNPVFVSLFADQNDVRGTLDIEKIKKATTNKTKMIMIANPANPLGMVVPLKTLQELLSWCEQKGIYLVIDEAYRDYAFTPEYESVIPLMPHSQWLICASTFSKNMAMSGWRIGYLLVPQKIAKALACMQDATLNCLNNTAQYAALFALEHPELSEQLYRVVLHNRDVTMNMLQPLIKENIIQVQKPDGGLFVFMKTDQHDATDLCMSILYKAKVSLVPGASFGSSGAPFLRLCYARDTEILQEGLQRLIKFFI